MRRCDFPLIGAWGREGSAEVPGVAVTGVWAAAGGLDATGPAGVATGAVWVAAGAAEDRDISPAPGLVEVLAADIMSDAAGFFCAVRAITLLRWLSMSLPLSG